MMVHRKVGHICQAEEPHLWPGYRTACHWLYPGHEYKHASHVLRNICCQSLAEVAPCASRISREAYGLVDSTAGLGSFGLGASSSDSSSSESSSSSSSLGGSIPAVAGCTAGMQVLVSRLIEPDDCQSAYKSLFLALAPLRKLRKSTRKA